MSKKHAVLVSFAVAAAIGTLVSLAYFSLRSSPTHTDPSATKPVRLSSESEGGPLSSSVAALVRTAKIERGFVTSNGPKAFSIVRNQFMPDGESLSYVKSLLAASMRGDATATYSIYVAILQCKQALVPISDGLVEMYKREGTYESYVENLTDNLDKCESLIDSNELMEQPWLQRAAEQGSIEAMIMFAADSNSVIGEPSEYLSHPEELVAYRKDAMRYLERAANSGSLDALRSLANAYEVGVLEKHSPKHAYAYYKAVQSVNSSYVISKMLSEYEMSMSSHELAEANRMSLEIQKKCCR